MPLLLYISSSFFPHLLVQCKKIRGTYPPALRLCPIPSQDIEFRLMGHKLDVNGCTDRPIYRQMRWPCLRLFDHHQHQLQPQNGGGQPSFMCSVGISLEIRWCFRQWPFRLSSSPHKRVHWQGIIYFSGVPSPLPTSLSM